MTDLLKEKVALITGGTTGIGRATAILLAQNGADVVIFGRHHRELDDALNDVGRLSGKSALGMIADTAHKDSIENVFREIDAKYGRIDILINNAGLAARSILDSEYDSWKYIIEVNILGYMLCARLALDRMMPLNFGHIVNIGSMSGEIKEANADLYVATKSAINGFNESLRKKMLGTDIKFTLIEQGSVGTDMIEETTDEQVADEGRYLLLKAEDIAESIFFSLAQPPRVEITKIQLKAKKQRF